MPKFTDAIRVAKGLLEAGKMKDVGEKVMSQQQRNFGSSWQKHSKPIASYIDSTAKGGAEENGQAWKVFGAGVSGFVAGYEYEKLRNKTQVNPVNGGVGK